MGETRDRRGKIREALDGLSDDDKVSTLLILLLELGERFTARRWATLGTFAKADASKT